MRLAAGKTTEQVLRLSDELTSLREKASSALIVPSLIAEVTTSLFRDLRQELVCVSEDLKNTLSRQVVACDEEMYDRIWAQMKPTLSVLERI
jgi:hypothetical protein